MTLPVPGSFIVNDQNYSRTLQEVPIISEHANIYVTESVTNNITNNNVKIVSPDFVTANAIATEPPAGRKIGAVYFDYRQNVLYAWNGKQWYKVGENLDNTVNGNVQVNGNLQTYNIITGNLTSSNIVNGGTITSSNTITGANVISLGMIQSIGNISGGNFLTTGNVTTNGITATGNVAVGNLSTTGNVDAFNVNTTGNINSIGNINGGNLSTTGNLTSNNTTSANLTVTANSNLQGQVTFGTLPTFTTGVPNTVLYINSAKTMVSGAELSFDGSNLGIGIQPATANLDVNGTGRVRANFSVLGVGDGLTISPGSAGLGTTISSRNQSFSGYTPLNVDAEPTFFRPNGTTANGLYISSTGIGANTQLPVSEMDINGVLSVTRPSLSPIDFRPNDDTSVNWRFGAYTNATKQGVLQLLNNGTGAGGGGTEALTVDQQNNYGFGTLGPLVQYNINNPNARINVNGSITGGTNNSTAGSIILQGRNGALGSLTNLGTEFSSGGAVLSYGMIPSTTAIGSFDSAYTSTLSRTAITVSDSVRIYGTTSATAAIGAPLTTNNIFTLTSTGLAGINQPTPLHNLEVNGNSMINLQAVGDYSGIRGSGGGNASFILQSDQTSGTTFWTSAKTNNTLHIGGIGLTEPVQGAMMIDNGGNVSVGSGLAPHKFNIVGVSGGRTLYTVTDSGVATDVPITAYNAAGAGDNVLVEFLTDAVPASRGSITFNRAAVTVAYNTVSDYRSKDIIGPVVEPGKIIDQLKVYNGRMKGATLERPMLIAHECQLVTPYAVTGEKDSVDENNNPIYQKVDHSVLVPLLLAEIQELRKRVKQLETK